MTFFYDDGKNVLRKAMSQLIPEQIINRKKQGFSAPDESWYRGENFQYVKSLLLNKDAVSSEYINPDFSIFSISNNIGSIINLIFYFILLFLPFYF